MGNPLMCTYVRNSIGYYVHHAVRLFFSLAAASSSFPFYFWDAAVRINFWVLFLSRRLRPLPPTPRGTWWPRMKGGGGGEGNITLPKLLWNMAARSNR